MPRKIPQSDQCGSHTYLEQTGETGEVIRHTQCLRPRDSLDSSEEVSPH